jgi:hypothetical protein
MKSIARDHNAVEAELAAEQGADDLRREDRRHARIDRVVSRQRDHHERRASLDPGPERR